MTRSRHDGRKEKGEGPPARAASSHHNRGTARPFLEIGRKCRHGLTLTRGGGTPLEPAGSRGASGTIVDRGRGRHRGKTTRADRRDRWVSEDLAGLTLRRELRHDAVGEELERSVCLRVADAAEVDLQRRLDLAEDLDLVGELVDHFLRGADERLAAFEHRLDGGSGARRHDLAVVRVLGRLVARPRADGLAEDLDVPLDPRPGALNGLGVSLGEIAVERGLDLLLARRVPGFAPGLAVGVDHAAHLLDAADVGHDHHVVAVPPGPDERLDRRHRGDPDRGVRLLDRPRIEVDVAEAVELTVVGDAILGPEPPDDVEALLEPGAALVHAHAEDLELLRDEGAPEAHVETAVAEVVQHRQLGGQLDRVVEGRDHGPGDRSDPVGAGRDGRQEDHGIRRVAAVVVEVVLDGLDRVEAEPVGALDQAQTVGEIRRGRIVGGPERREEVEAELHRPATTGWGRSAKCGMTSRAKRSIAASVSRWLSSPKLKYRMTSAIPPSSHRFSTSMQCSTSPVTMLRSLT